MAREDVKMNVISVENAKPIFSWCENLEESALEQMRVIARLPFVKHCAIMPDGHLGQKNGAPIGSVIATEDTIIPNFIGLDISCGMSAFKTNLNIADFTDEKKQIIHHAVSRSVPTGFSHNSDKRREEIENLYGVKIKAMLHDCKTYYHGTIATEKDILSSIGTLGGGNHFLEIQYDENGSIYCMIHSGSRDIGKKVCDYFDEIALKLNQKWYSQNASIPFLPIDTQEGKDYIAWMNLCVAFSFLNREIMANDVIKNLKHYFPNLEITTKSIEGVNDDIISISHNYASLENHFGRNFWVHRKGAVLARKGVIGIVPGSQSTNSFITIGVGEEKSLTSCSHGSGRKMSRTEFNIQNQDKMAEIEEDMRGKGIVFTKFGKSERGRTKGMFDISEAGGAYKDVLSVMENQKDLVRPLVKLSPLISWKG